jgi:hypothetical protein
VGKRLSRPIIGPFTLAPGEPVALLEMVPVMALSLSAAGLLVPEASGLEALLMVTGPGGQPLGVAAGFLLDW